ncbi:MAG: hypothetical protein LC733_05715 [Actinobacteria bacterium]|nr:hypothetical protein [Actinomycetota bacterium]
MFTRCFERTFEFDALEQPDQWRGSLVVQDINNTSEGTDPIVAAQTIGGNTLTPSAQIIACAVLHAVDVEFDYG